MTTIIEVAARNHLLKLQGHHSAREFQERLNRAIALAPGQPRSGRSTSNERAEPHAVASGGSQVVILTGVSGSGKSTALRALEDAGFYCVDNLPIVFLEKLLELSGHTAGEVTAHRPRRRRARGALPRRGAAGHPGAAARRAPDVEVLFLDASDESLVRRYSETRRRHPLAGDGGSVPDGIAAERAGARRI